MVITLEAGAKIKKVVSYWLHPGHSGLIATEVTVWLPGIIAGCGPRFYFNMPSDLCLFAYTVSVAFECASDPLLNWPHQLFTSISNGKNTFPLGQWWFPTFLDAKMVLYCLSEFRWSEWNKKNAEGDDLTAKGNYGIRKWTWGSFSAESPNWILREAERV